MNPAYLARMSADELDQYAELIGIDASSLKSAKGKAQLIERRRQRVATVKVCGMALEVPIKRIHDKRLSDRINSAGSDDEQAEAIMRDLLGDEQMAEVEKACTDEDGTVDVDAYGLVLASILTSEELKNF